MRSKHKDHLIHKGFTMATNDSRQPYTIKMWGTHLKSADTQAKLRKYDQLRNDPVKSGQIYDRTITFGMPIPLNENLINYDRRLTKSSNDRRYLIDNMTWSQYKKAKNYFEIFGTTLNNKYEYTPYVDVLTLPSKDRPHTFAQCIDFFYPMSGVSSHISSQYPFTTTYPQDYDYDQDYVVADYSYHRFAGFQSNKMPVDLGEITMMYIWFVMYKMILLRDSSQWSLEPDKFLEFDGSEKYKNRSLLSEDDRKRVAKRIAEIGNNITLISKVADVGGKIANAYAQGAFDNAESVEDNLAIASSILGQEINSVKSAIAVYASGEVANLLEGMGLSKSSARSISGIVVGKAMSPEAFRKLTQSDLTNVRKFSFDRIQSEFPNFKSLSEIDKEKIADAFVTKNFSNIRLSSQQANSVLNQIKSADARNFKKTVAQVMQQLKARKNGVRENGVLITLGIAAATQGVKYGLKTIADKAANRQKEFDNWFLTNKIKVAPEFTEEGFELAFDDYETSGLESSNDYWWAGVKMYCSPRNGLQMAEFARALYRVFRPSIAFLTNNSNWSINRYFSDRRQIFKILDQEKIKYNVITGKLDTAQFKDWFTNYQDCQTFKIFLENAYKSTAIVFKDIESFSPFTQAYGLEPVFLQGNDATWASGNPRSPLAIIGDPKARGKEYTTAADDWYIVPGQSHWGAVSKNAGRHVQKGKFREGCVYELPPYVCKNHKTTGSNEQGWTTPEVEAYYGNKGGVLRLGASRVRNSQRRLSDEVPFGHYGSTSLGFDVAYGVPIFNAQWAALTSVLSVYPKAMEAMYANGNGYAWAKRVYPIYHRNNPKMTPVTPEVFAAMKRIFNARQQNAQTLSNLRNMATPFLPGQIATQFMNMQGRSQATAEENSQVTNTEEDSVTGLYVALGLGITAIAGASYYVIQKKKGKF